MLGNNIRKIRKAKNMTARKLAELSGISLSYISQIENNIRTRPSPEAINRIAAALDVPVLRLIQEDYFEKAKTSEELISLLSDILEIPPEKFNDISERIILYNEDINKITKLAPILERYIYDSLKQYPESFEALMQSSATKIDNQGLELQNIVKAIYYNGGSRFIEIEINYGDENESSEKTSTSRKSKQKNTPVSQFKIRKISLDLPTLDKLIM